MSGPAKSTIKSHERNERYKDTTNFPNGQLSLSHSLYLSQKSVSICICSSNLGNLRPLSLLTEYRLLVLHFIVAVGKAKFRIGERRRRGRLSQIGIGLVTWTKMIQGPGSKEEST